MEDIVIGAEKITNGSGMNIINAEISDVRIYKRLLNSQERTILLTYDWVI